MKEKYREKEFVFGAMEDVMRVIGKMVKGKALYF
jgi:hypothetical protein